MNSLKLIFPLILAFNGFEATFVSVGDYPDYLQMHLNLPECGMLYKPTVHQMAFDECSRNKHLPKTYLDGQGNNLLFDGSAPQPQKRVYRGNEVDYGESPWTVFFTEEFIKIDQQYCTGVLITFEWLITAAHCNLNRRKIGRSRHVWAGSNRREQGHKLYVNKWFSHPIFIEMNKITNKTTEQKWIHASYDIALAKLENKFEQKTSGRRYLINPICLPGINQTNAGPETVTFFGYGMIEGKNQEPKYMQKADFELSSFRYCHEMFCANHTRVEAPRTCSGDSGGPLVQYLDELRTRAVLVGTLRGTTPLGPEGQDPKLCSAEFSPQSFWVPVPKVIHWILKTIATN